MTAPGKSRQTTASPALLWQGCCAAWTTGCSEVHRTSINFTNLEKRKVFWHGLSSQSTIHKGDKCLSCGTVLHSMDWVRKSHWRPPSIFFLREINTTTELTSTFDISSSEFAWGNFKRCLWILPTSFFSAHLWSTRNRKYLWSPLTRLSYIHLEYVWNSATEKDALF